jgi:hypothetical protein
MKGFSSKSKSCFKWLSVSVIVTKHPVLDYLVALCLAFHRRPPLESKPFLSWLDIGRRGFLFFNDDQILPFARYWLVARYVPHIEDRQTLRVSSVSKVSRFSVHGVLLKCRSGKRKTEGVDLL